MVKVERKDTYKAKCAIDSLHEQKKKSSGTYNTKEVNAALEEMFCKKCYLCEQKEVGSYQIEHRIPHRNEIELKFDWDNLFLACTHCNNIKSDRYNPILDCTKVDVDKMISFRKKGYFGVDEFIEIEAIIDKDDLQVQNTVNLLREIYSGSTPQKIAEAKMIRRSIRKELSTFKECVRSYEEEENNEDKEDLFFEIKRNLKSSSPFAAFKRWIVRDNISRYPQLQELVE